MSVFTKLKLNIKSVFRANGTFGGQMIANDSDGNTLFYACRVKRVSELKVELDRENVYQFIDSRWKQVIVDDTKAIELTYPLRTLVMNYGHLFTKDLSKDKDGSKFGMYSDTVVSVANRVRGHKLKIGDKVFTTQDIFSLAGCNQEIEYQIIGETGTYVLNIAKDPRLADRLKKLFDRAYASYRRVENSQPIGGMSWAANQDASKEFGKSRYNHRQLQRIRS